MATSTKRKTSKAASTGPVLKVLGQPEKPYRDGSARHAWWAAVQDYDGKPVSDFVAFVKTNPPSLQPKGKYGIAGTVEPPMGWVKFFVNQGLVKLS